MRTTICHSIKCIYRCTRARIYIRFSRHTHKHSIFSYTTLYYGIPAVQQYTTKALSAVVYSLSLHHHTASPLSLCTAVQYTVVYRGRAVMRCYVLRTLLSYCTVCFVLYQYSGSVCKVHTTDRVRTKQGTD